MSWDKSKEEFDIFDTRHGNLCITIGAYNVNHSNFCFQTLMLLLCQFDNHI